MLASTGSALAATTNIAITRPKVIIGDSNERAGDVQIVESGPGELIDQGAQANFTLALPEDGITFSGHPTCTVTAGDLAIRPNGTLSTNMEKVWDITSASTAASTITCHGIEYDVGGGVPPGDIDLVITSLFPGNPGLTPGIVANAEAVIARTINDVVGTPAKVKIEGTNQAASDITITETAPGVLLTATSTITLTLPAGVTFNGVPATAVTGAGLAVDMGSLNPAMDVATFHIVGESVGAADRLTVSMSYDVDNAVASVDGFTASALDSPVPKVTIGRDDQRVSGIRAQETFEDALQGTTFDITLPDELTWAETPSVTSANGRAVSASVVGSVVTVDYASEDGDGADTISIEGTGSILVDAAETLATGNIVATIDNVTIGGHPFSTTVKVGEAVAGESSLCFFRDCGACNPMVAILADPQGQTEPAHFIWAPEISWCRENAEAGLWDYLIRGECDGNLISLEGFFDADGVSTYEAHVTCEDVSVTTTSTTTFTSTTTTAATTTTPPGGFCGDGIIQWKKGERCEPGVGNECGVYANCIDCRCVPKGELCGDGIIQWKAGEQCEPGVGRCGPYSECIECRCVNVSFCGDGVVNWRRGEECEIGVGNECGPGAQCIECRCLPLD
jgi:hypothetical protein